MKISRMAALLCGGLLITACASNAPSPVGDTARSSFALASVDASMNEGERVPDRYDASVNRLLERADGASLPERIDADLRRFAAEHGGLSEDTAGERMLEFLFASELDAGLEGVFQGTRPVELDVEIVSTTFPNAATMMLVGEVIGVTYEFEVRDVATGEILVETTEPIAPFVQRSAGAGGGVLGLALRGGGSNRHVMDLQNLATASAEEIVAILSGGEIFPGDVEKLTIHRDRIERLISAN